MIEPDRDLVEQSLSDINAARVSINAILHEKVVGGAAATLPLPMRRLASGERVKLFKDIVMMICRPTDIAATFHSYTEALTLFSETQSRQTGKWLHWVQGAVSIAGGAAGTLAMIGGSGDKTNRLEIGVTLLGAGGLIEILKSTPLFKSELINEILVRVELNRQFGILLRQYTPAISEVKDICDAKLRNWQQSIPTSGDGDKQLSGEVVQAINSASIGLSKVFEGLINIGSAAEQIGVELGKTKLNVESVLGNLNSIAKATKSLRKGWLVDQDILNSALECMQLCESAP